MGRNVEDHHRSSFSQLASGHLGFGLGPRTSPYACLSTTSSMQMGDFEGHGVNLVCGKNCPCIFLFGNPPVDDPSRWANAHTDCVRSPACSSRAFVILWGRGYSSFFKAEKAKPGRLVTLATRRDLLLGLRSGKEVSQSYQRTA